jgi:hypothetical protein
VGKDARREKDLEQAGRWRPLRDGWLFEGLIRIGRCRAMITCEKCQTEFSAHGVQGYPGGTDPPGSHIVYAVFFAVAGIICGVVGIFLRILLLRTTMFALAVALIAGALLSLSAIPEARRICERAGGGICPACGHKNEVKWYS